MASFSEANQIRLSMKMKLSNYAWFDSSGVFPEEDGFGVLIVVSELNNNIRKLIPPVVDGISIKVDCK